MIFRKKLKGGDINRGDIFIVPYFDLIYITLNYDGVINFISNDDGNYLTDTYNWNNFPDNAIYLGNMYGYLSQFLFSENFTNFWENNDICFNDIYVESDKSIKITKKGKKALKQLRNYITNIKNTTINDEYIKNIIQNNDLNKEEK